MAEDYKSSREWQALNRIWKAVPQAARDGVKEDFRVITDMIKGPAPAKAEPERASQARETPRAGDENFLRGLSADARKLALGLITREGFNIYDYLADLARRSRAKDAQELFDAYVSQRDIDDGQEDALLEIMGACVQRAGA